MRLVAIERRTQVGRLCETYLGNDDRGNRVEIMVESPVASQINVALLSGELVQVRVYDWQVIDDEAWAFTAAHGECQDGLCGTCEACLDKARFYQAIHGEA